MSLMPYTTTATELQRNYKKVVKKAKRVKMPMAVLSNNKPELVIMDYDIFGVVKRKSRSKNNKKSGLRGLDAVFGSWTKKEADEFNKLVDEMNERIDPEDWK